MQNNKGDIQRDDKKARGEMRRLFGKAIRVISFGEKMEEGKHTGSRLICGQSTVIAVRAAGLVL